MVCECCGLSGLSGFSGLPCGGDDRGVSLFFAAGGFPAGEARDAHEGAGILDRFPMGEEVKRVRLAVFAGLLPGFVGARVNSRRFGLLDFMGNDLLEAARADFATPRLHTPENCTDGIRGNRRGELLTG